MADPKRAASLLGLTIASIGSAAAGFVVLAVEDASRAPAAVAPDPTDRRPARVVKAKRRAPMAITRSSR